MRTRSAFRNWVEYAAIRSVLCSVSLAPPLATVFLQLLKVAVPKLWRVALRNLEGETEIRRADIASMKSSGMSLMPEGLEALGEKNIRDIIGYLTAKAPKGFRVLDLSAAFTVDSRKGVDAQETDPPQIELKKFGVVMVGGVPFNIVNSAAVSGGKNLIMLRGRSGFSKTLPQQVEFSVNAKVAKLFLLGGITGGESPSGAEKSRRVPAAKARIYYADGKSEEIVLRSGDESADTGGQADLSASKSRTDLVASGQILQFSLKPQSKAQITKIRLESFDNHITPAFLAMTVQLSD